MRLCFQRGQNNDRRNITKSNNIRRVRTFRLTHHNHSEEFYPRHKKIIQVSHTKLFPHSRKFHTIKKFDGETRRMMERELWVRKKKEKGKKSNYVVEGRKGKKTVFMWTISDNITSLISHLLKTSFFSTEKTIKIQQKLNSLNTKPKTLRKRRREVPTIKIKRTLSNDYSSELWELSK